jgi:ribosome biogenesis GTPase
MQEFQAQVIAAFGRHLTVRDDDGRTHAARPFGRRLTIVCGDRVLCKTDSLHDEVHVVQILPRRSVLSRSTLRGSGEPIVANLDLVVAVMAITPAPDPFIIDRYLCAASSAGLRALVLVNKVDLLDPAASSDELDQLLRAYEAAGYDTVRCSSREQSSQQALTAKLQGVTSVFVGQSGVGKSSLIAMLVPQTEISIGTLDREQEGRHTTTASRLYDLPGGGALIDSPGVRDYAPAVADLEPHSLGFPEIDRLAVGCRFLDCQHIREPHCAVQAAVGTAALDARRYESYRRLRRLQNELLEAQGPARRQ